MMMMSSERRETRKSRRFGPLFTSCVCPGHSGLKYTCELPFGFILSPMALGSSDSTQDEDVIFRCRSCECYLNMFASWNKNNSEWTCPLCHEINMVCDDFHTKPPERPFTTTTTTRKKSDTARMRKGCCYIFVIDDNLLTNEWISIKNRLKHLKEDLLLKDDDLIGIVVFHQGYVEIYQVGLFAGIVSSDVHFPTDQQQQQQDRLYVASVKDAFQFTLPNILTSIIQNKMKYNNDNNVTTSNKTQSCAQPQQQQQQPKIFSSTTIVESAIEHAINLIIGVTSTTTCGRIIVLTNNINSNDEGIQNNTHFFRNLGKYACSEGIGIDVFYSSSSATPTSLPLFHALVETSGGYALLHSSLDSPQFEANLVHVLSLTKMVSPLSSSSSSSSSGPTAGITNGCVVIDLLMPFFIKPTRIIGPAAIVLAGDNDSPTRTTATTTSNDITLLPEQEQEIHAKNNKSIMKRQNNNVNTNTNMLRILMPRFDPLATLSVMLEVTDDVIVTDDNNSDEEENAFFQIIVQWIDNNNVHTTRVYSHSMKVSSNVHDFLDGIDRQVIPVFLAREAMLRGASTSNTNDNDDDIAIKKSAFFGHDENEEELAIIEAQRTLDATIHRISRAYRLLNSSSSASNSGSISHTTTGSINRRSANGTCRGINSVLGFAFPPELADALRLLYHVRRTLLGLNSLTNTNNSRTTSIRNLFLRLPLEDNLAMMAPELYSTRVDVDDDDDVISTSNSNDDATTTPPHPPQVSTWFERVPCENLALWSNVILAVDHYDCLIVWSGKLLLHGKYDTIREACKEFLFARSADRFPFPTLYYFSEDDDNDSLASLVAPSHADPTEQQFAHFSALASLPSDQFTSLISKFHGTNDDTNNATDPSFRQWFWNVASASSDVAKDRKLTLCE